MSNPTLCSNLILFFIIHRYLPFQSLFKSSSQSEIWRTICWRCEKVSDIVHNSFKTKKDMISNEFLLNTLQSWLTELFFLYFFWTSPCSFTDLSFLFARLHFLYFDFWCCFVEWVRIFIFKNLLNTNFKKY